MTAQRPIFGDGCPACLAVARALTTGAIPRGTALQLIRFTVDNLGPDARLLLCTVEGNPPSARVLGWTTKANWDDWETSPPEDGFESLLHPGGELAAGGTVYVMVARVYADDWDDDWDGTA